ncbi:tetratricopeptide repeat protein [Roseibium algae]|uniref:Tetratricopeptide repeat protein n=1 Tax=Roseibium algae TaxID=3123038 RepID=A0ABU8TRC0_9HYPH
MITARTLSLTLLTTALMLPLSSTHVFASQMSARIERQTADAFDRQQEQLTRFELETEPGERLAYARFLVDGLITSSSNPIRVPAPGSAADIYRDLLGVDDQRTRIKAAQELRSLLLRFGDDTNFEEIAQLEQLLQSETRPAAPETAPVALSEAETEQKLRREMADGSLDAALDLLVLLRRQGSEEAEVLRGQMLYLANIRLIDSDSSVIKLTRRYAETLDAEDHPETLAALLELAAGSGSDAVMSIVNAHREQLAAGDVANVRDIIWKLVASGSDRAMEVIALDLVDNPVFGFDREDALWAVSSLEELQNFRTNYLIAKLYYQGIHVKRDLPRAISAMERMLAQVSEAGEDRLAIADRFSRMNLSEALIAKYALPLYLDLRARGDARVITRIARIVTRADRAGYYASPDDFPLPVDVLISELETAYQDGSLTAGSLLAEIFRDGRLVPQQTVKARQVYEELLLQAAGDTAKTLLFQEQIAKIMREELGVFRNYSEYHRMVRGLVDGGSVWAKREYGKLLLKGAPRLEQDSEQGFALLIDALEEGYLSAGSNAAAYALETDDKAKLVKLAAAYDRFDPRTLTPEDTVFLARINYTLGDFKKALGLLEAPEMASVAQARFLLAKAAQATGQLSKEDASAEMRDIVLSFAGDDRVLLTFIDDLTRQDGLAFDFVEPVLARLAQIADTHQVDAIEQAFQLRQKWPQTQSLSFKKVVDWCRVFAERGRGGPLSRVARNVDVQAVGEDNYRYLIDTVEAVLSFMPTNGNLRMFVARQYVRGKYREKDAGKAKQLIREAAELGNESGLFEIANTFYYGQGVEPDRKRAMAIYRDLAFIGSNRSALSLARLYSKGPNSRVYEARAFAHFARAATSGSVTAMTELGRSYIAGAGSTQDVEKGLGWLERAAARGSTDAMVQLYYFYFVQNPSNNNPQAEQWLNALVEADVPDMIIRKAVSLRNHSKDEHREEIDRLLDRAEELGSQFARRLRNIYLQEDRAEDAT